VVLVVEILIGVAVLVGVALVASRDISGLDDAEQDVADIGLPDDRLLRSEDIDRLQFRAVGGIRGLRGYRFADVDETMVRVKETLKAHESAARPAAPGRRDRSPQ
jgi:hypothetical protein